MTAYIRRISEDWIVSHGTSDLIGSDIDPLLLIELLVESDASWSWSLINSIIELDEDGNSLLDLIYGPLASWIYLYSESWIEIVEDKALESSRFQWALGGLKQGKLTDETWIRVCRARGAAWPDRPVPPIPDLK